MRRARALCRPRPSDTCISHRHWVSSRHFICASESRVAMTTTAKSTPQDAALNAHYQRRNTFITETLESSKVRIRMADPDDETLLLSPPQVASESTSRPKSPTEPDYESAASTCAKPETVLQYERSMNRLSRTDRAGGDVSVEQHLHCVYDDEHLVVCNKPSGMLSVPSRTDHPSLLGLVHATYGCESSNRDNMIVHRLDYDTSGLMVFAKTQRALKGLQKSFRKREVTKRYEALLVGHLPYDEGVIDLPLQRDHRMPPYMRISTHQSEVEAGEVVKALQRNGYPKIVHKKPKPSQTEFAVISREFMDDDGRSRCPVTRIQYSPITGRTHQLRVHSAAIGHAIVADKIYGIHGEGTLNGGFDDQLLNTIAPGRASFELQENIHRTIQKGDNALHLHAKELGFDHPVSGETMAFEAVAPF